MDECRTPEYCLVKYFHWEATGKHLDCRNCVMKCKYRESVGESNDKSAN